MSGTVVEHFARLPREVVLHRMATATWRDDQMFWGIVLLSVCGPIASPCVPLPGGGHGFRVVQKDPKGFLRKDQLDNPQPANLRDLREVMGWPKTMKAEVTRIIQRLEKCNSVCWVQGELYLVKEPAIPPPEPPPTPGSGPGQVVGTRNFWLIGRLRVPATQLPTEPDAKSRAVEWLDKTGAAWLSDLQELRAKYADLFHEAAPNLGITIPVAGTRNPTTSADPNLNGDGQRGRPNCESPVAAGPAESSVTKLTQTAELVAGTRNRPSRDTGNPTPPVPALSAEPILISLEEKKRGAAAAGLSPPSAVPASPPAAVPVTVDHGLDDLVKAVRRIAVPTIGADPTIAQYYEIRNRLKGASLEQYIYRMEAKQAAGGIYSVSMLMFLADDCAKSQHVWQPPGPKLDAKERKRQEAHRRQLALMELLGGET